MRHGHLLLAGILLAAGAPAFAHTQTTTEVSSVAAGSEEIEQMADLPPPSFWEGGGVRVTEGTVLHPSAAVSGAYQTNVFYQDSSDGPDGPISSALARFSVGAAWGSIGPGRMQLEPPGGDARPRLAFLIEALPTWNQYLSSDETLSDQSDLGIGLNADVKLNPGGKVVFSVRDS